MRSTGRQALVVRYEQHHHGCDLVSKLAGEHNKRTAIIPLCMAVPVRRCTVHVPCRLGLPASLSGGAACCLCSTASVHTVYTQHSGQTQHEHSALNKYKVSNASSC
jgi:hypothetical protein